MPKSLLFAPIPALVGSLFIMQSAQASRVLIFQQCLIFIFAVAICASTAGRWRYRSGNHFYWIAFLALAVIVVPMLSHATDDPRRWISIGGLRFYVSAFVLPAAILALGKLMRSESIRGLELSLLISIAIAFVLALQPDASQVSAFALAMLFLLSLSRSHMLLKICAVGALAICVAIAWQKPDPLNPISYVEGVLDIASSAGIAATVAAWLALALPPVALAIHARATHSWEILSVVIYYLAIDGFAYFQLTPMPFLGFGAGPMLGYFLALFFVTPNSSCNET